MNTIETDSSFAPHEPSRREIEIVLETSVPPGTEVYHYVDGLGKGIMANQREQKDS